MSGSSLAAVPDKVIWRGGFAWRKRSATESVDFPFLSGAGRLQRRLELPFACQLEPIKLEPIEFEPDRPKQRQSVWRQQPAGRKRFRHRVGKRRRPNGLGSPERTERAADNRDAGTRGIRIADSHRNVF